jgi:hypothetical protein
LRLFEKRSGLSQRVSAPLEPTKKEGLSHPEFDPPARFSVLQWCRFSPQQTRYASMGYGKILEVEKKKASPSRSRPSVSYSHDFAVTAHFRTFARVLLS